MDCHPPEERRDDVNDSEGSPCWERDASLSMTYRLEIIRRDEDIVRVAFHVQRFHDRVEID